MSVSREQVSRCADATGFRRETMEKVLRLGEIVADVGRHPFLSTALILKGGTALNLFFGAPRRLSVDLDFNYVAGVERSKMLQDRPEVERAVQLIASARGYKVQVSSESHAGRKLFLRYVSVFDNPDHIEVDLNFLMRIPLLPPTDRTMWLPEEEDLPAIRVAAPEELAAGKLCALLSRAMPRDLFDTTLLPGILGREWNLPRFRGVAIAFAGILDHPLFRYGPERFDRVTDDAVRESL